MEISNEQKKHLVGASFVLLVVLIFYFAVQIISEVKAYGLMGQSATPAEISFDGHGEVDAVPNIADVNFSIQSSLSTQSASSDAVNTKTKSVLDFLATSGIASTDIQTQNYSSYPDYSNPTPCPPIYSGSMGIPCQQSAATIIGYTVSQDVSVKIRNVNNVSTVVDGINKIGVTNMSGPNFTIDNPDAVQAQARQKAIDDAKSKATELAKELGVSLGKIVNFSESGNNSVVPMYAKAMTAEAPSSPVPSQIPTGQNTITSDVTITYEIR